MPNLQALSYDYSEDKRYSQARIRIRIPQQYHHEPIISHLASHYNLQVNILAAILGKNARGDGWFDLELRGDTQKINSALIDLAELNIEIWHESAAEIDGW